MTELQKHLNTGKPLFKVEKIKTPITIPQKALSKLYERVANAKNTFAIPAQMPVKRLLLIDDAVGSGATMNEIALKIKQKGLSDAVLGVAITGSYKGFEVISEL
jgi:predicted amidophosphoribosyltransferase